MLSNNLAARSHKLQTATNRCDFFRQTTLYSCYGNGLDHNLTPSLFTILDTRSVGLNFLLYDRLVAKRSRLGVAYR